MNFEPVKKDGYSTDLIADAACRFIEEASKERAPYFCYVPFNAPHPPFQAKEEDLARFRKPGGTKDSRELVLKAMIWSLDQGVGRVLQAIEKSGEAENTQVWFVSDNGRIGGVQGNNLPLRGNKLTTFEGGVRVAACVRWPVAWKGGRKVEQTMGYLDVMPTVLASARVNPMAGEVPRAGGQRLGRGIALHIARATAHRVLLANSAANSVSPPCRRNGALAHRTGSRPQWHGIWSRNWG